MAATTNPAKILLVTKNPFILEATRASLAGQGNLSLMEQEVNVENLSAVILENQPDVILLDFKFQPNPLLLVESLTSEFPSSKLIAILSESEIVNLERVVLSGARAFIQYPYQADKLPTTIRRVLELSERNDKRALETSDTEVEERLNHTFTVFSPKGGAGTTTIATNLAISLHKALDEDVLLIDGKHLLGHVALYLNLRTANSITDLIAHAGMLDQQLIKQVTVKHASGIHALPSPNSISEAQGIKPESLFKVVQSLKRVYPNILIDGGNNLNDNAVTYMDSSEKILLVLTPDLASLRDVRQFLEIAASLSYPKEKILLILNQAGRKADLKFEEIEDILKMKIFGSIPADGNLALSSLNEGVPIVMKKSRHAISKAYRQMAKNLVKNFQKAKEE